MKVTYVTEHRVVYVVYVAVFRCKTTLKHYIVYLLSIKQLASVLCKAKADV